jgi:very-short-patch-repair endonuclease
VDDAVAAISERQAGALARWQAFEAGASAKVVRDRRRSGTWVDRGDGLYTLRGVPETHLTRLWLACLAPGAGAVVSHEAAADLHGIATFRPGPAMVTVPHATSRLDHLATVHQSRRLYPEHVTLFDGLRVTTIARTLIDLAALYRRGRMEIAVDDALASRKLSLGDLCATFDDLASRGRTGTRLMRAILEDRQPGYIAPQSVAESMLLRVLRLGGLPRPVLQFPHPSPLIDGFVDGAYVAERILVEADGRRWHTKVRDIDRDHERDHAANLVGWDTYRYSWDDLTKRADWVVDQLRQARRRSAA